MARAARTASVIVVLLGALALGPSIAYGAVIAKTEVIFPAEVTVGQTGVTGSIVLTNLNDGTDFTVSNNVCNVGSAAPCDGMRGISLVPACVIPSEPDCDAGEPGVFDVDSTAVGTAGLCSGTIFGVSDLPGPDGEVLFTPTTPPGEILVTGENGSCTIEFEFDVLSVPTGSPGPGGGIETFPFAEAEQYSASGLDGDEGSTTVEVHKATPSIATQASAGIALGGTVTDTATVTGRVNPTGLPKTVTFYLFGPDDPTCQPPEVFTSTVPVADNGTATSAPFMPTAVGTYRWLASYDGDDNNTTANSECGGAGETVIVTPAPPPPPPPPPPATPAIAILASPGVTLGGRVSAAVNVTGRRNPVPGATVLFRLFGPDDPGCAGSPVFAAAAAVSDAGFAASPPFAPAVQSGTYRWIASYNGDVNNVGVATACGGANSTVVVQPLPASVLSAGFASQPRVGAASFLDIAAFDPLRPITGMQVQFGEPRGLSGASACRLEGFGITVSPVHLRLPYIFRVPGRHVITIVVLSGGCGGELTRTVRTIVVTVAANTSTRAGLRAAREPAARAAQSTCKNRLLRPTSKAASRLKVATAILCLVNVERRKKGLQSLKRSRVLALAANGHSKDMFKRHFFEHAGPGGPSFQKRLTRVRYRGSSASENIGYGSRFNAKLMVQAWMNSPPHKANILSPRSKFAGIGIAIGIPVPPGSPGSIYTMNFGSSVK